MNAAAPKLTDAMADALAALACGNYSSAGIDTFRALERRGLVTANTSSAPAAHGWRMLYMPTVEGWIAARELFGIERPADAGRATVEEAMELAYPHNEQVTAVDAWMASRIELDRERREAGRLTVEQALTEAYPETDRAEERQHFADTHPRNAYPLALNAVIAVVRELPHGGGLRVSVVDGGSGAVLMREDLHALAYSGHTTPEAVEGVRAAVNAHIRHGERPVHLMFPPLGRRPALYLGDVLALLTRWDDTQAAKAVSAAPTVDASRCEGHYGDDYTLTSGAGIGETTYCDGSCNTR